ncbi:hypothetical protein SEA_BANTAM_81 [Gordonia phage Bantam]|uniref:Uncharacterized protein n=1 Tax=Gordonia phage Bantam TaxID=1887641 RepID=A0A1B3AYF0_9CAUD|nr:hypothetical protein BIZ77_gp098 [Gordonia phage Bantam]AOE43770.1 hypothetical protein SEA_BANTAM_81 [Gordonia phage Bantam]
MNMARRVEIRRNAIRYASDVADDIDTWAWMNIGVDLPTGMRDEIEQALRTIFSKIEVPSE